MEIKSLKTQNRASNIQSHNKNSPYGDVWTWRVLFCLANHINAFDQDNQIRYDLMKAYLMTRAAENVMTVASANSISRYQTAPTAVFDYDGEVNMEAQRNREEMLVYDFEIPEITFGMKGRIVNNNHFIELEKNGFQD